MKNEIPVVKRARLRSEAHRFRGCAMRAYLAKNWEMAMFYHFVTLKTWDESMKVDESIDDVGADLQYAVSFWA